MALVALAVPVARSDVGVDSLLDEWRWTRFTVDVGLPSNHVEKVVETGTGSVYAATTGGIAWYDGYGWIQLGPEHGIPDGAPTSLEPDRSGDGILAVIDGRLFEGDRRDLREIELHLDGRNLEIGVAFPRTGGGIVVGQGNPLHPPLWVYKDRQLSPLSPPSRLKSNVQSRSFWMGRDGTLWINTDDGLYSWDGSRWHHRLAAPGLYVWSVAQGENGDGVAYIDLPARLRGLWTWRGDGPLARAPSPEGAQIAQAIDVGPGGDAIVVYTSGHVRVRREGRWRSISTPPPQLVGATHLTVRRNGDLWAATSRGLYVHASTSKLWTLWRQKGLDNRNQVHEILRLRDGTVWIATGRGVEVRRSDGSLIEYFDRLGDTPLDVITGLAEDGEGHVWISSGATFAGAFRWNGRGWKHFGPADGLDAPAIHKIRIDRRGRPWFLALGAPHAPVATGGPGAFVLDGGRFVRWDLGQGLGGARVYSFAEASDGTYWFGTWSALSRYRDGKWKHWRAEVELEGHRPFALAIGPGGRVWFGDHRRRNLGYVDGERVEFLGADDGFLGDGVWDLRFDGEGRLWISTPSGVVVHRHGLFAAFGQQEGLVNPRTWPVLPAGERVYIGTLGSGTAILDLEELRDGMPRARLRSPVSEGGGSMTLRWSVLARDGTHPTGATETRYRLDGGPWSHWSPARQVTLRGLAAGRHAVEVQAKGPLADPGPISEPVRFSLPYPLVLQPAFYLPVGLLSLLTIGFGVSYVVRKWQHDAEKRRLEQQLRQSQKMEALGRLAGGVAHDFNNLLTVIGGYAQLLQRSPIPPASRDAAQQIDKSAERAAALTRQLLAFSRRQVLRPRVLNPNAVLLEMQPMLDRLLGEDVELVSRLDPAVGRIEADPGQIEQVLLNLAVNARDAMPHGGLLTIETSAISIGGPQADVVRLAVTDSGCGMDEETRARAFEPFFTTKELGKGTGLGLSTVYGIVTQSGGQIGIDSTPGMGTRVSIDLPCVQEAEPPRAAGGTPPRLAAASEVVLVVEDEEQVREFTCSALEMEGYTVLAASGGDDALRVCEQHPGPIDLLLTDVVMPRRSGPEVARDLRQRRPGLKVLYMSGYASERLLSEQAGDPGPCWLAKPFSIDQLRCRVREVLDEG